ncbi:MAG TPA: acyltransferase family protein [Acidobacteriaceae bacterium]|nr:acyltransferase family protein [Acidobacteriaceae bacterium]
MSGATESRPHTADPISIKQKRVIGLDSLRFVCATIVVLDHLVWISFGAGKSATGLAKLLIGINNCLFNGPAAVIVFFIISGFCIHFPYKGGRTPFLPEYFSRRLLRIVPPALVFFLYLRFVINEHVNPQDTVLWSVICEIIYYLLYPLLLTIRRSAGWVKMIVVTYSLALALAAYNLKALAMESNGYAALGLTGTWILGLPCWLMGCWLAENYGSFPLLDKRQMWMLRSFVFAISVGIRLAKFHVSSPLASNCFTLNLFALLALFWVGSEIVYLSHHCAPGMLESAGQWSYSIYLAHSLLLPTLAMVGLGWLSDYNKLTHLGVIVLVFPVSYAFSLVIEKPSHRLAVKVGKLLKKREHATA